MERATAIDHFGELACNNTVPLVEVGIFGGVQVVCFLSSSMGKIQGTLRMRRHICLHHATSKYFSNSFVFKHKIEKEGLPRDSPVALGAGGPRFKSGRPGQSLLCFSATLNPFYLW